MSDLANYMNGFVAAVLYCFPILLFAQDVTSPQPQGPASTPLWQYGGFVDLGYSLDFNHPANGIFRSRGTVWHVDKVDLNGRGLRQKKGL